MKVARLVRREVGGGCTVPTGWRMAWYDRKRRTAVYGPVPLHWMLRWGREFGHRVRAFVSGPAIEQMEALEVQRRDGERQRLADEYSRGYLEGWRACFEACLRTVEDEFEDGSELWEVGELLVECSPDRQN